MSQPNIDRHADRHIAWLPLSLNPFENSQKFLHYRDGDHPWQLYRRSPHYQPDAEISSRSGFATAQRLLKLGYVYVSQGDLESERMLEQCSANVEVVCDRAQD